MKERKKRRRSKDPDVSVFIVQVLVNSTATVCVITVAGKVKVYGGMEVMLPHSLHLPLDSSKW